MRLYEIDRKIEEFESRLAEAEGVLDEDLEHEWQELIDSREDKWRSYIAVIRQLEAEEEVYKTEANRLLKASKSRSKGVDWLKQQLLFSMQGVEITEAKTDIGKLKIMSASVRPVLLRVSVDELPENLKRVTTEANLSEIGRGLKDHDPVAEEVAEFGQAKLYVRIF